MDKEQLLKLLGIEALKASPPVAVTAAQPEGFWTMTPVTILTCIYLVLQIAFLLWRWRRHAKGIETEGT